MSTLLWLLLPVAAISGWLAAAKHFRSIAENNELDDYSPQEHSAVDSLVDTQPDKAVDIVIDKVEVSPETVEVHLALGKLYRRSGEVNRAIRFHQNLIEKHSLSNSQRESILYELGRDYLSAGLLDRAERIFKDLLTTNEFKTASSKALIEVFQQEKDWDEALEYAEMYESLSRRSQKTRIGHYYCEKAEKLNAKSEEQTVKDFLLTALKKDKSCIRANILLGKLFYDATDYESALKYYTAAVEIDRSFASVVFDNLIHCIQVLAQTEGIVPVLPGNLNANTPNAADVAVLDKAELFSNQKKAIKFIEQQLEKEPTFSLMGKYLLLSLDDPSLTDRKLLNKVKDALFAVNKKNATYKCVSCGLGVHALHWQCPSCSNWSTIKPL